MEESDQYLTLKEVRELALRLHGKQYRRDGFTPYYTHLDAVADRVGTSLPLQQVAYLHDSVEDGHTSLYRLEALRVAPGVVKCVETLTHKEGEKYFDYIRRVQECPMATRVKIADILANLSDSPTPRQIRKYARALLMLITDDK